MYSLTDYLWMISDRARVSAYAEAIAAQVRPGQRVLEVGAGFGFFSVLAARAGAAHVDAVDTNPVIHLGPKVAAANGCADRITFHHIDVRQLQLEVPADVLIIDIRGPTPFGPRAVEIHVDARERLLKPGGVIIAARDTVYVAPTRIPEIARREVYAPLDQPSVALDVVERVVLDTPMRYTVAPDDLVAEGVACGTVDYSTVVETRFTGQAAWTLAGDGTIGGLAVWFDADLGGGIRFSTRPGSPITAYRQLFVPFRSPVTVRCGDRFRIDLGVVELGDSNVWHWRATLTSKDSAEEREVANQNSVAEIVIDPARLEASFNSRGVVG